MCVDRKKQEEMKREEEEEVPGVGKEYSTVLPTWSGPKGREKGHVLNVSRAGWRDVPAVHTGGPISSSE